LNNKNPLIFLITHDADRRDNSFTAKLDGNIIEISFRRYSDLLDVQRENLRKYILSHYLHYVGDYKSYE
jgi:hypothetical protein